MEFNKMRKQGAYPQNFLYAYIDEWNENIDYEKIIEEKVKSPYNKIIKLWFKEHLTYKQISEIVGLSVESVRNGLEKYYRIALYKCYQASENFRC